jgi:hypothetical protein
MSIPMQSIVDVQINISSAYPARAGFGTLLFLTTETGVLNNTNLVATYQSIDGVADDWESNSEVYKAANTYFSQNPRPAIFKVGYWTDNGIFTAGNSGSVSYDIADIPAHIAIFKSVHDGAFNIAVDGGAAVEITGLNFASVQEMADVAAIISPSLPAGVSVNYSAGLLVFTSDSTGINSSVLIAPATGAGTDIVPWFETDGAGVVVSGQNPVATAFVAIEDALDAIEGYDSDWYGLAIIKTARDNPDNEAAADWVESRTKIFGSVSNDETCLSAPYVPAAATHIFGKFQDSSLRRTMGIYSSSVDEYPECSILARAFTTNFNQLNSTITLKFKETPTVTVENLTSTQKTNLDSYNANAVFNVAGYFFFGESFMANGLFFDEIHGTDWQVDAIQKNVFGLLKSAPKVPYTNKGLAMIEQKVRSALDEGVRNGLIAEGYTIDGEYLPNGYKTTVIPVEETNQSDIEARFYGGISFVALLAGAIHRVQITGLFER